MSKLLEFLLGSLLIATFTLAFLFFSALHHLLRAGGFSDCTWQASARAWIDSNRDGQMDDGEPPLSDVAVHVDQVGDPLAGEGGLSWPAVTNQAGSVQFNISIPGCSNTLLEIYVNIPDGYRLTTRPRIAVRPEAWRVLDAPSVYYFGFVSDR
jgi:hypothetical protein